MNIESTRFNVLPVLLLIYMSVMLSSAVLSNRLILFMGHITMGGTLVAPFWFVLSDLLAEIYGYKFAKKIIFWSFMSQVLFALICKLINNLPSPQYWSGEEHYQYVISPLFRNSIASFVAFMLSGYINIYLLTKWKVLLKGRYFWLRSMGSSCIGELIFTCLGVITIQYGILPWDIIGKIIIASFSLKVACSILISPPANIAAYFIKKVESQYIPEDSFHLNPFKVQEY